MSVTVTASAADFGAVAPGASGTITVTVQNDVSRACLVRLTGDTLGYFSVGPTSSVTPGTSLDFTVTFAPAVFHASTFSVNVETYAIRNNGTERVLDTTVLTGTVAESLTITTGNVDFGRQLVGSTSMQSVMVANETAADATVTFAAAGGLVLATSTAPAGPAPVPLLVQFTPTAAGAVGPITLTVSSGSHTDSVTVSGTGYVIAPPSTVDETVDDYITSTGAGTDNQRFVINIPTPHTYLGLGKSLSDVSSPSKSSDGVCISTVEDVYISATTATSTIHLDAGQHAILEAVGTANVHADGTAILSSDGGAYVLGIGGVVIAAGFGGNAHGGVGQFGVSDTSTADTWGLAFTIVDIVVGAALTAMGIHSLINDWNDTPGPKCFLEGVGITVGLAGVGTGMAGAAGAVATTTVLGVAGVTCATPAFLALYGLAGAGMISMFPTIFGFVDAQMLALDDVAINALTGTASVQGGSKVDVNCAGVGGINLNSMTGKSVGQPINAAGGAITVDGQQSITMKVGPTATSTLEMMPTMIDVETAMAINLKCGPHKITVGAQSVVIKSTVGTITVDAAGIALKHTGGAMVAIGAAGVEAKDAVGAGLKLSNGMAELKNVGGDKLQLGMAGATISGKLIKLG